MTGDTRYRHIKAWARIGCDGTHSTDRIRPGPGGTTDTRYRHNKAWARSGCDGGQTHGTDKTVEINECVGRLFSVRDVLTSARSTARDEGRFPTQPLIT